MPDFLCHILHVFSHSEAAESIFIVASVSGAVHFDLQEKTADQATKSAGYEVASYYTSQEDSQHIYVRQTL